MIKASAWLGGVSSVRLGRGGGGLYSPRRRPRRSEKALSIGFGRTLPAASVSQLHFQKSGLSLTSGISKMGTPHSGFQTPSFCQRFLT